jgi:2-dehydro-3-deoxyglucarate aldolase
MNRQNAIECVRSQLRGDAVSVGSWIQIPDESIAEVMGAAGYDWIAVDLEHGSISAAQLPGLFRAIESGGTLPLARVAQGEAKDCKRALDAGAGGIIVPMIENAAQLEMVRDACCWPPTGKRGVGFSRANLFGGRFSEYAVEAQAPLLIAQIENISAVHHLEAILDVRGLDAIMVGPYDLSASLGATACFDNPDFIAALQRILELSQERGIAAGIHVVPPDPAELGKRIAEGYRFLAYSIDAVFLRSAAQRPIP